MLEDGRERLEPHAPRHECGLAVAAAVGDLASPCVTNGPEPEVAGRAIERRLAEAATGSMLPFAASGRAGRTTSSRDPDAATKRLEIDATRYASRLWRSGFNASCERFLLGHTFDRLDCVAVEFRTPFLNVASRRAIERLGARPDGASPHDPMSENGTLHNDRLLAYARAERP